MREVLLSRVKQRALALPAVAGCLFAHGDWVTWSEARAAAEIHARALEVAGIGAQEVVVITAQSPPVVLKQVLGCWLIGAVPAPLPPVVGGHSDRYLRALRPGGIFTTEGRAVRTRDGIAAPHDASVVLTTSGSTGEPKPVVLSWRNLHFMVEFQASYRGLNQFDTVLTTAPFCVVPAMVNCLVASLWTGAAVWVISDFARIRDELVHGPRDQVTVLNSIAEVCSSLTRMHRRHDLKLPSLRAVYSGGSYVSPRVRDEWEAAFDVPLVATYGMTECSATIAQQGCRYRNDGTSVEPDRMYAIPGVALRCVDEEGRVVERGQVQIKGPNVMLGYLHQAEATAKALSDQGWLTTQDVGVIHPDSGLTLEGRVNRVLKVNGHKIAPEEIERLLEDLPMVEGAMVQARRTGGRTRLVATLEGPPVLNTRALRAYLGERLPPYKIPHHFCLGRLHRSASGKVLRTHMECERRNNAT